jgi:hypothetical protein
LRNSVLLDRGSEKMLIFPEERVVDARGNNLVRPNLGKPLTRWVNVVTDRQTDAELVGQVSVKILRCSTRTIPGTDSQARVWFRGEWWDLAIPPKNAWQTRALSHSEYILRSRNQNSPNPELVNLEA